MRSDAHAIYRRHRAGRNQRRNRGWAALQRDFAPSVKIAVILCVQIKTARIGQRRCAAIDKDLASAKTLGDLDTLARRNRNRTRDASRIGGVQAGGVDGRKADLVARNRHPDRGANAGLAHCNRSRSCKHSGFDCTARGRGNSDIVICGDGRTGQLGHSACADQIDRRGPCPRNCDASLAKACGQRRRLRRGGDNRLGLRADTDAATGGAGKAADTCQPCIGGAGNAVVNIRSPNRDARRGRARRKGNRGRPAPSVDDRVVIGADDDAAARNRGRGTAGQIARDKGAGIDVDAVCHTDARSRNCKGGRACGNRNRAREGGGVNRLRRHSADADRAACHHIRARNLRADRNRAAADTCDGVMHHCHTKRGTNPCRANANRRRSCQNRGVDRALIGCRDGDRPTCRQTAVQHPRRCAAANGVKGKRACPRNRNTLLSQRYADGRRLGNRIDGLGCHHQSAVDDVHREGPPDLIDQQPASASC